MKKCSYCGAEYPDNATVCAVDETSLDAPHELESATDNAEENPPPPAAELAELDMGFSIVEGFSRPDWKAIHQFVKNRIAKYDLEEAWKYIATTWLKELEEDLGGTSHVYQSHSFSCVSDLEPATTRILLDYAERIISVIRNGLGETAWTGFYGKHVLLFFSDPDDYYAYISYYYKEGTHILTSGVFIRKGYAHIALPYVDTRSVQHTLVHELCHNLLCHLPIPTWLNEGIAVVVEQKIINRPFILDHELADRHRAHWNEANIQTFWAGRSYKIPGENSELSYSLGQILVTLLSEKSHDFIIFVKNADWRDAGQDASQSILGLDLGEVLGGFLGPGNWRPQRKALAEQWKTKSPA